MKKLQYVVVGLLDFWQNYHVFFALTEQIYYNALNCVFKRVKGSKPEKFITEVYIHFKRKVS